MKFSLDVDLKKADNVTLYVIAKHESNPNKLFRIAKLVKNRRVGLESCYSQCNAKFALIENTHSDSRVFEVLAKDSDDYIRRSVENDK